MLKCQPAAALVVLAFLLATGNKVWADAVVITDCTEEAFTAAVAGGGTVTFSNDCTITLSQPITVYASQTNVIDAAGHKVTISGGSAVQIFKVSGNLTLVGLTLSNGKSTSSGGALYVHSNGVVAATNCVFTGNKVVGPNGAPGAAGANDPVFAFDGGNGGAGGPALGGAIWNAGTLSLTNCTLTNNSVTAGNGGAGGIGGNSSDSLGVAGNGGNGGAGGGAYGGAIYNGGILNLTNCTVSSNSSIGGNGGPGGTAGTGAFGGRAGQGGTGSNGAGGGIYNGQEITVGGCTFAANRTKGGNSAAAGTQSSGAGSPGLRGADGVGAGLSSTWSSTIINSTFYTNICFGGVGGNGGPSTGELTRGGVGGNGGNGIGGGVQNSGTMHLENCTLSSCGAHGGTNGLAGTGAFTNDNGVVGQALGGDIANTGGSCPLKNSLIVLPQFGPCGFGTFVDDGYNLISDTSIALPSGRSFANVLNPKLGSFGMNGGPTATIPLLGGSPAINRIPPDQAPPTDQRGVPRPIPADGLADIGAFESAATSPPVIVIQPQGTAVPLGASVTFSVFAVGETSLGYQWFFNGSSISNATRSSYTIPSVGTNNVGTYFVRIKNDRGSLDSDSVSLNLKPSITSQLTNIAVAFGTNATFRVSATADPAPTYQWSFNGTNIDGATDDTLLVPGVQLSNIGTYIVTVINDYGTNTSSAQLDILPTILSPPTDQMPVPGSSASFSVYAEGSPTLGYQWQFNGANLPGATNTVYTLSNVQQTNIGSYLVVVTNSVGTTISDPARLDMQPFIMQQPVNQAVPFSAAATFSVQAGGSLPLGYMWSFDGNPIPGATTNSYKVPSAQTYQIGTYSVLVTNAFGAVASAQARLDLLPTITLLPVSQTVPLDGRASFSVTALGNQPLSYQWQFNGVNLPGQTGTGLTIESVQSANVGAYSVLVANSVGSTSSPPATLAIGPGYTIRGFVNEGTLGLSNVMVVVSNAVVVAGAYTNFTGPEGSYAITVTSGSYTVTPSLGCYFFNPASRTINVGSSSVDQVNFLAYTNDIFAVRGRVTEGVSAATNVVITLGERSITNATDGTYAFAHVCPGPWTIKASRPGYGFTPASRSVQLISDTNGLDFVMFPVYTLEGRVMQGSLGLSNVTVRAGNQSTNTDMNGYYMLSDLAVGTYTVTPTQACRVFTPGSRTVSLAANTAGVDFFALDNNIYAVRGTVTKGGTPLPGVTLQLGNETPRTTDSNGNYAFLNLCEGTYTLTPSLAGYAFFPRSVSFSLTNDLSSLNFAAAPALLTIQTVPNGHELKSVGTTGGVFYIHTATNVLGPWQPFLTISNLTDYVDHDTSSSNKFYRLSW